MQPRYEMKMDNLISMPTGLQDVTLKQPEKVKTEETKPNFWDVIGDLNETQKVGQQKMSDVMTGKTDDTQGALVAVEKASLYTEIATTVRDKAVFGFNKLMDMQI